MQPCNRIYYSKIYWRFNMFRAAHRSSSGAPNCICSLWFIYPYGDRQLSRLGENPAWTTAGHHIGIQTRGCKYSLELLMMMMSGMSLETCWTFNKFWNNKFYYKVAACWLFLLVISYFVYNCFWQSLPLQFILLFPLSLDSCIYKWVTY